MRTVKELSDLTGISVRTLHYYDEIGLLHPTKKSEAGYRFYDDQSIDTLRQILYFREFDLPLREIKAILEDPTLDHNQVLKLQRDMLSAKKERLEQLIASIDTVLNGGDTEDFSVFSRTEIEALWENTLVRMPKTLRECIIREFGSLERWKEHYIARVSRKEVQQRYEKVVEWYGDKETMLQAIAPRSHEVGVAFAARIRHIESALAKKRCLPVNSFEVRQLIGEYGFVIRQYFQIKEEAPIMHSIAVCYRDPLGSNAADETYGAGSGAFFAQAIECFYSKEEKEG